MYFTRGNPPPPGGGGFPDLQVRPSGGGQEKRPCPQGTDGWMTCPICGGNGVSMQADGLRPCIRCQGQRRVVNCDQCNGSGWITVNV
jgi:hypothetical protein